MGAIVSKVVLSPGWLPELELPTPDSKLLKRIVKDEEAPSKEELFGGPTPAICKLLLNRWES